MTETAKKEEVAKVDPANPAIRPPVDEKLFASYKSKQPSESIKKSAEDKEENRDKKKPASISSVAQLRDAAIASGHAATTEQVAKVREIEEKDAAEGAKKTRLPSATADAGK